MLLYLLNVLLQTVQENCVGPTRICEGDGIQYWPSTGAVVSVGLEELGPELVVGGPI
jgi:hypothetical protein